MRLITTGFLLSLLLPLPFSLSLSPPLPLPFLPLPPPSLPMLSLTQDYVRTATYQNVMLNNPADFKDKVIETKLTHSCTILNFPCTGCTRRRSRNRLMLFIVRGAKVNIPSSPLLFPLHRYPLILCGPSRCPEGLLCRGEQHVRALSTVDQRQQTRQQNHGHCWKSRRGMYSRCVESNFLLGGGGRWEGGGEGWEGVRGR